jgi:hypothetical protein
LNRFRCTGKLSLCGEELGEGREATYSHPLSRKRTRG